MPGIFFKEEVLETAIAIGLGNARELVGATLHLLTPWSHGMWFLREAGKSPPHCISSEDGLLGGPYRVGGPYFA